MKNLYIFLSLFLFLTSCNEQSISKLATGFQLIKSIEWADTTQFDSLLALSPNLNPSPDIRALTSACESGNLYFVKRIFQQDSIKEGIWDRPSPLMNAISSGNLSIVSWLVEQGVNINYSDANGYTPLILASTLKDPTIANYLLEKGAIPSGRTNKGSTALINAVENNNTELVRAILKHNVSTKGRFSFSTSNCEAPLKMAVSNRNFDIVNLLLDANADINEATIFGTNALTEAVSNKDTTMVALLLKHNAKSKINYYKGNTAIHSAILSGDTLIAHMLIEAGADIKAKSFFISNNMNEAIAHHHLAMVSFLLNNGFNINDPSEIYLHRAVDENDLDIVKLLIKNNANINQQSDGTPLDRALDYGRYDIAQYLISKGGTFSNDQETINEYLRRAYINSCYPIISILKEKGAKADFSKSYVNKRSCIKEAVKVGCIECIKDLLDLGANINKESSDPVLHYTINYRKPVVLTFLLENGADVNIVDDDKQTALHHAARYNDTTSIMLLLKNGADINLADNDKNTPLEVAAYYSNKDAFTVLQQQYNNKPLPLSQQKLNKYMKRAVLSDSLAMVTIFRKMGVPEYQPSELELFNRFWEKQISEEFNIKSLPKSDSLSQYFKDRIYLIAITNMHFPLLQWLKENNYIPTDSTQQSAFSTVLDWDDKSNRETYFKLYKSFQKGKTLSDYVKLSMNYLPDASRVMQLYKLGAYLNPMQIKEIIEKCSLNDLLDQEAVLLLDSYLENGGTPEIFIEKISTINPFSFARKEMFTIALLEMGFSPYYKNKDTDLFNAAREERRYMLIYKLLTIGYEIKPQLMDELLLEASYYNNPPLIKYLLQKGADIHYRDKYEYTALHKATTACNKTIVKYLLDHGAQPRLQADGESSIDLAKKTENVELIELLINYGRN